MNFQEIFADSPENLEAIGIMLQFAAGVCFIILVVLHEHWKKYTKTAVSIVVISIAMIAFGYMTLSHGEEKEKANIDALVSNIEMKYNVDEVVLNGIDVDTSPEREYAQPVNVVVEGVTYTFHLTQDKNTWEPTLTNPPIAGGSSEIVNVSAEDLLK